MFWKIKSKFLKKFRIKTQTNSASIINQKTPGYKPFILLLPSLLTITLFTLIPFILVITDAFKVQVGFKQSDVSFGMGNFTSLFGNKDWDWHTFRFKNADLNFIIGIRNSILYSLVALPISLIISVLISSAIANLLRKTLRGFWQTVFFLPYVTSGIAVSVAFYFLFSTNGGLINSILGKKIPWLTEGLVTGWKAFFVIVIRGVWGNLAFQILLITTAMLTVNPTLYKAASVDGSGKFQQFFSITLPSIRKTMSFLITIGIIGGIKTFPLALFNNSAKDAMVNGGSSIMLYIYNAISFDPRIAAAASLILFILGVAISFTLRKLVSFTYNLSINLGVKNVSNKIMNKAKVSKKEFKF